MTEKLDDRSDAAPEATEPGEQKTEQKTRLSKAERLEARAARLREAEERRAAQAAAIPDRAQRSRALVIALSVLSAVTAALVTLLVITFVSWNHQRDVNSARTRATEAAKTFALDFGSYDYRHLDADFHEVATRMTANFAKHYIDSSTRLEPTFVQYKTQVSARIKGVGVTSVSSSRAVVIVLLDQTVRTSQSSTPRLDRNRLEVHLVHERGKWLVQQLFAK
jgi:Mce-associated membrane protein